jgi:hypothetical protein
VKKDSISRIHLRGLLVAAAAFPCSREPKRDPGPEDSIKSAGQVVPTNARILNFEKYIASGGASGTGGPRSDHARPLTMMGLQPATGLTAPN